MNILSFCIDSNLAGGGGPVMTGVSNTAQNAKMRQTFLQVVSPHFFLALFKIPYSVSNRNGGSGRRLLLVSSLQNLHAQVSNLPFRLPSSARRVVASSARYVSGGLKLCWLLHGAIYYSPVFYGQSQLLLGFGGLSCNTGKFTDGVPCDARL